MLAFLVRLESLVGRPFLVRDDIGDILVEPLPEGAASDFLFAGFPDGFLFQFAGTLLSASHIISTPPVVPLQNVERHQLAHRPFLPPSFFSTT